jgi:predicted small secreted protein
MKRRSVAVAIVLAAALMAGCGGADDGGGDSGSAGDEDLSGAAAAPDPAGGENADEADGAGGDAHSRATEAQPVVLLDPSSREIVYTVDLTVDVDDVIDAIRRAAELVAASGGFVAAETTEGDDSACLTLRVPTEAHSDIVTRLEDLGEVRNRFRSAEDVTE